MESSSSFSGFFVSVAGSTFESNFSMPSSSLSEGCCVDVGGSAGGSAPGYDGVSTG